jgi:hypothetical protein
MPAKAHETIPSSIELNGNAVFKLVNGLTMKCSLMRSIALMVDYDKMRRAWKFLQIQYRHIKTLLLQEKKKT